MKVNEAIKRIRQETAPCTYIPDFDKEKCLGVIERHIELLKKITKQLKIELDPEETDDEGNICNIQPVLKGKVDLFLKTEESIIVKELQEEK